MELQQVDAISLQTPQTQFEVATNDIRIPMMSDLQVIFMLRVNTTALRGQHVFLPAAAQISSDPFLCDPVVGRGVQEIDARVQNPMQKGLCITFTDHTHPPRSRPPQTHPTLTQTRDG